MLDNDQAMMIGQSFLPNGCHTSRPLSVTPQKRFYSAAKCWHNTVVDDRISDSI